MSTKQTLNGRKNRIAKIISAALVALVPFVQIPSAQAANDFDGDAVVVTVVTDQEVIDTDGDGVTDKAEEALATDPNSPDSDNDGMEDGWEVWNGLNPVDASDAAEDPDADAVPNDEEFFSGSSPFLVDTDDDRFWDGVEIDRGTDPASADSYPNSGVEGDVDQNGTVTILDLQYVVNTVLGSTSPFPTNVNSTGDVDILDVQHMVGLILNG